MPQRPVVDAGRNAGTSVKSLRAIRERIQWRPRAVLSNRDFDGGYGTWSIASKHPGKFAALAPICGGVRPPARVNIPGASNTSDPNIDPYIETARKIGKTPVWIFHGGADPVVPPDESRK